MENNMTQTEKFLLDALDEVKKLRMLLLRAQPAVATLSMGDAQFKTSAGSTFVKKNEQLMDELSKVFESEIKYRMTSPIEDNPDIQQLRKLNKDTNGN